MCLQITRNGINALMLRYLDECRLLQMDDDADITPYSIRLVEPSCSSDNSVADHRSGRMYHITHTRCVRAGSVGDCDVALFNHNRPGLPACCASQWQSLCTHRVSSLCEHSATVYTLHAVYSVYAQKALRHFTSSSAHGLAHVQPCSR